MLAAFANAFRSPDLRKKIFFTLGILAIFRLGSIIPTPNVNVGAGRLLSPAGDHAGTSRVSTR